MADAPVPELVFHGQCPDCGERQIDLPPSLPDVGDDFDWQLRDFDSFRRFMLEELFARFPERSRWTPADLELVLVEALSAVLDQLSDMADRVASEAFLETARRPESVRRLLRLIGYDALALARAHKAAPFDSTPVAEDERTDQERFDDYWLDHPTSMDEARQAGPRAIHTQRRMVTVSDYASRLEEHPLVLRAHAWSEWSGSWSTVRVAIIGWKNRRLDEGEESERPYTGEIEEKTTTFHKERQIAVPAFTDVPTIRTVLRPFIEAYRMVGQEILLEDARPVGIVMSLSVQVAPNFFQSEVRRAVEQALGTGPGGFFEPGRLRFGESLYAADIFQTLMSLDGVQNVCLNRFKRLGDQFADQAESGVIVHQGLEIAVMDNDPAVRGRGYFTLKLHGGRRG